jgi:hypothetical protein
MRISQVSKTTCSFLGHSINNWFYKFFVLVTCYSKTYGCWQQQLGPQTILQTVSKEMVAPFRESLTFPWDVLVHGICFCGSFSQMCVWWGGAVCPKTFKQKLWTFTTQELIRSTERLWEVNVVELWSCLSLESSRHCWVLSRTPVHSGISDLWTLKSLSKESLCQPRAWGWP